MSDTFDPYYEWLGIPPKDQPPNHYRLLGIELFEDNANVIDRAADRQMGHVRTFQAGRHSKESQKLLNELSAAKVCLLKPDRKAAYNARLREQLDAVAASKDAPPDPQAAQVADSSDTELPPSAADDDDAASVFEVESTASASASSVSAIRRYPPKPLWRQPAVLAAAGAVGGVGILLTLVFVIMSGGGSTPNGPDDSSAVADQVNSNLPHDDNDSVTNADNEQPAKDANDDDSPAVPDSAPPPPNLLGSQPVITVNEAQRRVADQPRGRTIPPLPLMLRRQIESAAGMVTADFAFCQNLDFNRGAMLVQQLRPFGLRPIRFRPYLSDERVLVAILWTRDDLPWRIVAGTDDQAIWDAHKKFNNEGFEAIDLAGFGSSANQFIGLWAKPSGTAVQSDLIIGLAPSDLVERAAQLTELGLVAHTKQAFVASDGLNLESQVWKPIPDGAVEADRFTGTQAFFEERTRPGDRLLDIQVSRQPNGEVEFGACLVRGLAATQQTHNLSIDEHLSKCRDWTTSQMRPLAISVVAVDDGGSIAASVWSEPSGQLTAPEVAAQPAAADKSPAAARYVLLFDGRDFVELNASKGLTDTSRAFTAETWVRLAKNAANLPNYVMGSGALRGRHAEVTGSGLAGWLLMIRNESGSPNAGGRTEFRTGGAGSSVVQLSGSRAPFGEEWHHLAVCNQPNSDGSWKVTVFCDGQPTISKTRPASEVFPSPISFCLGISPFTAQVSRFAGEIRALRISSSVLYQQAFQPSPEFGKRADTEVLLDFSQNPSGRILDISGHDRHGTISGATWVPLQESTDSPSSPAPPNNRPLIATAEPPTKRPLPAEDARQPAVDRVKKVFQNEMAAAKEPSDMVKLAAQMLEEADEEDDSALKFALLMQAKQLSVSAADLHAALRAVDEIEQQFEISVWPLKADAISGLVAAAKTDRGLLQVIASEAVTMIEGATADGEFSSGEKLANTAQSIGLRTRDAELRKRVLELKKVLGEAKGKWAATEAARATLEESPDDPDANLVVGKYLCFFRDDWATGLAHLTKAGDAALAEAARNDIQAPQQAKQQLELANAWYAWAETAEEADQNGALLRAQHWYAEVAPHVSGLDGALVRNRLDELSKKIVQRAARGAVRLGWLSGPVGEIKQLTGHTAAVTCLAVTRSGRLVVSGSRDDTVRIWDLAAGEPVGQIQSTISDVYTMVIAPDDKHVIVGGNSSTIEVWSLATGRPAAGMKGDSYVSFMKASSGRRPLLLMGKSTTSKGHLALFDMGSGRPLLPLQVPGSPTAIDLSRSGRYVAVANSNNVVIVWDLQRREQLPPFQGVSARLYDVSISSDERMLAACTNDGIVIWDLAGGKEQSRMRVTNNCYRVDFSPDNRRLISTSGMHELHVWNAEDGKLIQTLIGQRSTNSTSSSSAALASLPDARGAVSAGYDGIIRVWRLPD